jgi:hypothetical protein
MNHMQNINIPEIKTNLLSGLTVALAMVPEAIAFALIGHVSPLTGVADHSAIMAIDHIANKYKKAGKKTPPRSFKCRMH